MNISLVVPLWNEEANVPELVASLAQVKAAYPAVFEEAVLVNNGSRDSTGTLLKQLAPDHPWLVPLHLPENLNYGGGIYAGCQAAKGDFIVYIPGDLQYSMEDLRKVVETARALQLSSSAPGILVKGSRSVRHDGASMGLVSGTYTRLANMILNLRVQDVNGLPKLFPKALLDLLPTKRMVTFTFDAQVLDTARNHGFDIREVEVEFLARRAGVSSWSGKRFRVYLNSIRQLWEIRRSRPRRLPSSALGASAHG